MLKFERTMSLDDTGTEIEIRGLANRGSLTSPILTEQIHYDQWDCLMLQMSFTYLGNDNTFVTFPVANFYTES
jgi:hypothetical protein